ncbi:MAG: DUF4249 domain-containing protein [Bacteroidales bacterium]|nr:DUF4249 domain-containing protein [Bacteroidales bacterium]MCF8403304.1 DUF4249 domain-containing protein [Bacteroidales bacterium]
MKELYGYKALVIIALCSSLALYSCVDEYLPKISKYENLLVVDGLLTNGSGPFTIHLSFSTSVDKPEYKPYTNCLVYILDNMGNEAELNEIEDGKYETVVGEIEGVVGRSYKIKIVSPNGKTYASGFEELLTPLEIDTLYPNLEYQTVSGYTFDLPGYQFYLSTEVACEINTYVLWQLEKTYQYNADYTIKYIYDDRLLLPFSPSDSLFTCWKTSKIDEILLFNTSTLSVPVIEEFPILFVSTATRELMTRYSLLVNQLTLTKETFDFWNNVREQNSGETSLFTQQLYHIRGNVENLSDPAESVLGYFTVAGKASQRIFVDKPQTNIEFYYPVCVVGDGEIDAYKYIRWTDPITWPLYVVRDETARLALPQAICTDCRERGGDIFKPEFWIDSDENTIK